MKFNELAFLIIRALADYLYRAAINENGG